MRVEEKIVIGDTPVELLTKFCNIEVYVSYDKQNEGCSLYFSADGEVEQIIDISADCCQNFGYIGDIEVRK